MTTLRIDDVRTDGGTQSRVQLDWIATGEYAGAMKEGAVFPPIVVFHDGNTYWLADGFHRLRATETIGLDTIEADVRQGTQRDAVLYSVGANHSHGVRRSNADKRAAVLLLLNDAEWQQWSDREIARRAGVDHKTVTALRPKPSGEVPQIETRKATRNGTTYEVNTANIGKRMADPTPPYIAPAQQRSFVAPEPAAAVVAVEPEPLPIVATKIAVINADSSRYLTEFVTEPVHLVVTSPPYNVGIDYNAHSDEMNTHLELLTAVWQQCHAVMVEGARIAVVVPFGIGRAPWVPFATRVMETLQAAGFTLRGQIIWDKNTTGNRTSWGSFRMASAPALRDTTECIIIAHKGNGTLAIPSDHTYHDDKGTFTAWLADSNYFMELAQDHWVVGPESAQRIGHPAPFPTELVERLIHFYGYPSCHVVDPFGGSGTVGVAAQTLGCTATLFDISEAYCQMAEKRIANGQ